MRSRLHKAPLRSMPLRHVPGPMRWARRLATRARAYCQPTAIPTAFTVAAAITTVAIAAAAAVGTASVH